MRIGEMGASSIFTPNDESASSTADTIAAGTGSVHALAGAFHSQRIQRRRRFHVNDLDVRYVRRERQQILAEGRRERLRVLIEHQPLEQRVADPMRDTTDHLPVHHRRIDRAPAVVQNAVPAAA